MAKHIIQAQVADPSEAPSLDTHKRVWKLALFNPDGTPRVLGEPGPQGAPGDKGPLGDKGPNGEPGLPGDKGPAGDVGPQGDKGIVGNKGATGDKGPIGNQGPTGDVGPRGPVGDKGPTGDKGLTGDKGPVGDQGPVGNKGLTGDKGPSGDVGSPAPTVVTTLPQDGSASPLIIYVPTPGIRWLLSWDGASASPYKWEFVGGSELLAQTFAQENLPDLGVWEDLPTAGPQLIVPAGGDYLLEWEFEGYPTAAGGQGLMGISAGGGSPGAVDITNAVTAVHSSEATGNHGIALARRRRKFTDLDTNDVLLAKYGALLGAFTFMKRVMTLKPIRLGPDQPRAYDNLNFASSGDQNGLFYRLGTKRGTQAWTNPVGAGGLVAVSASSEFGGNLASYLTNRLSGAGQGWMSNLGAGAEWVTWDLGAAYRMLVNHVSLGPSADILNSDWKIQGSLDGATWTDLTGTFPGPVDYSGTWLEHAVADPAAAPGWRYLRWAQVAGQRTGFGEIEFYGTLTQVA